MNLYIVQVDFTSCGEANTSDFILFASNQRVAKRFARNLIKEKITAVRAYRKASLRELNADAARGVELFPIHRYDF